MQDVKLQDVKFRKAFGQRLKIAFKEAGLKGKDVARLLGVAENTVSQYTQGKREPKLEVIFLLYKKAGINPLYVIAGEGPPILPVRSDLALKLELQTLQTHKKSQEAVLKIAYEPLVCVLESIFDPWRVIPQAVKKEIAESLRKEENIYEIFKKVPKKLLKAVYSFVLEIPGETLFFIVPYWRFFTFAIWRVYWALRLNVPAAGADLAAVGMLAFREENYVAAARKLLKELQKDWPLNEKEIKETKIPLPVSLTSSTLPAPLRFLCQAAYQLLDLTKKDELPSFCLAHHRAYWAECPVCREIKGKEESPSSDGGETD